MILEQRAFELLSGIEYANVATVSGDGTPWNTPVYAVTDEELSMYWSSWKEAEHSKNIIENSRVFVTLYDTTRKRGDNNRRCLYLKGVCAEVEQENEVESALELLYGDEEGTQELSNFLGDGLRRVYRASFDAAWLNDKSERQVTRETIKMRVEIDLSALKDLFSQQARAQS